jgi:ribosomal-protein-alanine N-acetyltransferase
MRYLGGACSSAEAERRWHRVLGHWTAHGFGQWVVLAEGDVAGLCGLEVFDEGSAPLELIYMLAPEHWGRGIARRAARQALKAYPGFRIAALTQTRNEPSRRLLEDLDFVHEKTLVRWDAEQCLYVTAT